MGYTAARALIEGLGGNGRHRRHRRARRGRRRPAIAPSALRRALAESPAVRLLGSGGGAFQEAAGAAGDGSACWREHPRIDGVWTGNDLMAFGALEALAEAGRSAKVVGINGLPGAIERIEQGTMLASVDFSAFNIAAIAARAALRHLAGEAVPQADHDSRSADRPHQLSAPGRCRSRRGR